MGRRRTVPERVRERVIGLRRGPLLVADRRSVERMAHPDRAGWRAVVPEHGTEAGVPR
jgi:hypothetical protein